MMAVLYCMYWLQYSCNLGRRGTRSPCRVLH